MKSRRGLAILIVVLLVITSILYGLANRYLIEHVQVANAMDNSAVNSGSSANTDNSTNSDNSAVTNNYGNTVSSDSSANADNWSYKSDSETINIKKVVQGSGNNTITYYVADVVLKDSSSLKSAFAKNEFGNNIVEDTSVIASNNNAVFAINGDYYGFRDDGIVLRNGKIFRDNGARGGLAFYNDGTMKTYDETSTSAKELVSQGATQTLSFGPVLVKDSKAITDFGKTVVDTNLGNRSIQDSNPRTGVGIISANHYVFIVVDGRSTGYSKGMTLSEFAKVFEDLGCTDAYNLDGGGSSTMYFKGQVINNPLGRGNERGVSDILYVN